MLKDRVRLYFVSPASACGVMMGFAAGTCSPVALALGETARPTQTSLAISAGLGVEHVPAPALAAELRHAGYSEPSQNAATVDVVSQLLVNRLGIYVALEAAVPSEIRGPMGSAQLRRATYRIGATWTAYEIEGFSTTLGLGMFLRDLRFKACSDQAALCPGQRMSGGGEAMVRLQLQTGDRESALAVIFGSAIGYRQEGVSTAWRGGSLEASQPKSNTSGAFSQLFLGFWLRDI